MSFATSDRRVCACDRSNHCEDYDKIRSAHTLSFLGMAGTQYIALSSRQENCLVVSPVSG